MTYYVTDWDRIGGTFYDKCEEALEQAEYLAKKHKGNCVYVYNLIETKSFYHPIDVKKYALQKSEAVLETVLKEHVMQRDFSDKVRVALEAVRDALVECDAV